MGAEWSEDHAQVEANVPHPWTLIGRDTQLKMECAPSVSPLLLYERCQSSREMVLNREFLEHVNVKSRGDPADAEFPVLAGR